MYENYKPGKSFRVFIFSIEIEMLKIQEVEITEKQVGKLLKISGIPYNYLSKLKRIIFFVVDRSFRPIVCLGVNINKGSC